MIQIQNAGQFKNAAAKLQKEKMRVRRYEPSVYEVTNTAKGHTYLVRFERRGAHVFGQCTCEAGTPSKGNRVPMVCKHLFAAVLLHRAIVTAKREAARLERERAAAALALLVTAAAVSPRAGAFAV